MTRTDKALMREEQRLLPPTAKYRSADAQAVIRGYNELQQCGGRPCALLNRRTAFGGTVVVFVGLLLTSPIVFGAILGIVTVMGITNTREQPFGEYVAFVIFGLVLLSPIFFYWKRRQADAQFGEARLLFGQTDFRVGDEVYLEYERQLREPSPEMGWVSGHVACVEIVRTRQGTDYSYSETVLWEHTFDPAPLPAERQVLKAYWNVTLPKDLPNSRMEKDRWVVWHWQFRDDFGRFSDTYDLNLKTLPALRPLD